MRVRMLLMVAALAAGMPLAPSGAHPGHQQASTSSSVTKQVVDLPASGGRKVHLTLWATPNRHPRGVVIFGHGMGGTPDAYLPFLEALVAHGYSVIAPLAVDSRSSPDREKYDLPKGFAARVEDLMVARGFVAQRFAGQKVALAGHSYGSLFAMMGGGAKTPAGMLSGPPVAAVLALSTPGRIPGVVPDDAFRSLSAPLMLITATADTVPGFVANARDHRLAFDTAPAGRRYLLTVQDGNHDLMLNGEPALRSALTRRALTFLDAYVANDPAARRALARPAAIKGVREERR